MGATDGISVFHVKIPSWLFFLQVQDGCCIIHFGRSCAGLLQGSWLAAVPFGKLQLAKGFFIRGVAFFLLGVVQWGQG